MSHPLFSDGLAQTTRLFQSRAARIALLGAAMIVWQLFNRWWAEWPGSTTPDEERGPLAAYRVAAGEMPPRCRDDRCTVKVVPVREGQPVVWLDARLELPPPRWIEAPEGLAFVANDPRAPLPLTLPFRPEGHDLLPVTTIRPPLADPTGTYGQTLPVPHPGVVLAGRLARTPGHLMQADGKVTDEQGSRVQVPDRPLFSALLFQAVPHRWTLEIGEAGTRLPEPHATVLVLLRRPRPDAKGTHDIPPHIRGVVQQVSGRRLTVGFTGDDLLGFMRSRATEHAASGSPLWTAQPVVQWNDPALAARSARVPSSSIVADGTRLRVWTLVQDFAVPVMVQRVSSFGEWDLVHETPGLLGLPIRPEDWRQMPPAARSAVYREIFADDAAAAAPLLTPDRGVLRPDGAELRPGQRVKGNA